MFFFYKKIHLIKKIDKFFLLIRFVEFVALKSVLHHLIIVVPEY